MNLYFRCKSQYSPEHCKRFAEVDYILDHVGGEVCKMWQSSENDTFMMLPFFIFSTLNAGGRGRGRGKADVSLHCIFRWWFVHGCVKEPATVWF